MDAFLAFASDAGIWRHPSFALTRTSTEGYGAIASDAFREGEVIVRVPRTIALSISTLDESIRQATAAANLSQAHALALEVCRTAALVAAGVDARAPWLAMWPVEPEGSWVLNGEVASLKPGDWSRELERLDAEAHSRAREAHEKLQGVLHDHPPPPTWDEYRWAMSIVTSRAADLVVSGECQPVLLPLIDVLNHRTTGHTCTIAYESGTAGATDSFVLRCVRDVAPGETLTINYGHKENAELMHGYGFACCPNPHDAALLRVPLAKEDGSSSAPRDPMFEMQRAAMLPRGMVDDHGCLWVPLTWQSGTSRPHLSSQLRAMLTLATASSTAELFAAMSAMAASSDDGDDPDGEADGDEGGALGTVLEPKAWALLAECCEADLAALPTWGENEATPHIGATLAVQARRALVQAVSEVAGENSAKAATPQ